MFRRLLFCMNSWYNEKKRNQIAPIGYCISERVRIQRNRVRTERRRSMEDKRIIDLFFDRDERAIEYTSQKYGRYCYSIADKILRDPEDDRECLNDVWLAAWNSIPPNNPPSLSAYLGKVTRNQSVMKLRSINRNKRGRSLTVYLDELSEAMPDACDVEAELERTVIRDALSEFIRRQGKTNRHLFVCRYYYLDSIEEIAERFGMTQSQVKLRLFRMRKKLKEYLEKEGIA